MSLSNLFKSQNVVENVVEKKVGFKHGNSVIVNDGPYKGRIGFVNDFSPPTYDLSGTGEGYVEYDGYPLDVGEKTHTSYGPSVIKKIIPAITNSDVLEVVVYNDDGILKLGYIWVDKQYAALYFYKNNIKVTESDLQNPNNVFIAEITIEGASLIEQLLSELGQNENLKNTLKNPLGQKYIDEDMNVMYLNPPNTIIKKINKKDIVETYFLHISTVQSYPYDPRKNQYYVSYTQLLQFKPTLLTYIKNGENKGMMRVKSGPYANKYFNIVKYNDANLKIVLDSDNTIVYLPPKKVFYVDMILTNGNYAECVKIIADDGTSLTINERNNHTFTKRDIITSEISKLVNGFYFSNVDVSPTSPSSPTIYVPTSYIGENSDENNDENNGDDDDDEENKEYNDYGDNDNDNDNESYEFENTEGQQQQSFKDIERTTISSTLNKYQLSLIPLIQRVARIMLGDEIEEPNLTHVLTKLEHIIKCIKQQQNSDIKLEASNNIKYIISHILLFYCLSHYPHFSFDNLFDRLFPAYFNDKDVTNDVLNDIMFIEESDTDLMDSIKNIIKNKKKQQKYANTKKIVKLILLKADKMIQKCLGTNINFLREKTQGEIFDLIPLGIKDGNRIRDIEEEKAMQKIKNKIKNNVTYKNIMRNDTLPQNETKIDWGHYISILDKYKFDTQQKTQNYSRKYIIDNIYRIPFALQENLPPNLQRSLTQLLDLIKRDIQEQILKINLDNTIYQDKMSLVRNSDSFRNMGRYDEKGVFDPTYDPSFEDDSVVIKDTGSYLRQKNIRDLNNKINKTSRIITNENNKEKSLQIRLSKMTPEEREKEEHRLRKGKYPAENNDNDMDVDMDIDNDVDNMDVDNDDMDDVDDVQTKFTKMNLKKKEK